MSISLRDAIDKTLLRIGLAQGADVQVYAEEQIKEIINHKFNILFDSVWWPQFYNPGEEFTLDGVTGVVTDNLNTKIKRFMDIRSVWYEDDNYPLPSVSTLINPRHIKLRSIVSYSDDTKVFKVLPSTTTGTVTVAYRTKPDSFELEDDVIDMDEDLIVLGAAYDYLDSLGTNPDEAAKLLQFFDTRFKTLTEGNEVSHRSTQSYGYGGSGWQDAP